jgi:hypothetical protein
MALALNPRVPGGSVTKILLHRLRQELGGREQDGPGRQHHQELEPNWRVATFCRSIIGLQRLNSQGIMSTKAVPRSLRRSR